MGGTANPGALSPGSANPSTISAIAGAIKSSPILGAAQVLAGIYGAYSSYEMSQALQQIDDLTSKILDAVQALKIEVQDLAQYASLGDAQSAVVDLGDVNSASPTERDLQISNAYSKVNAAVETLYNDCADDDSFISPFFMAANFQAEVIKTQITYEADLADNQRIFLTNSISRGCKFIMRMEDDQRAQVGPTAGFPFPQPIGVTPHNLFCAGYTLDGQIVQVTPLGPHSPSLTDLAAAEAARQQKIGELLADLSDLRSTLRLWITTINLPVSKVTPGKTVALWCDGGGPESTRFLNGLTGTATLDLQELTDPSGTHWRVDDGGHGSVSLYCLGGGPEANRCLNGITGSATLSLVDGTGLSGAHWQISDGGDGAVQLKCLGNGPEATRWLNGLTGTATVDLQATNPSGTKWRVLPL